MQGNTFKRQDLLNTKTIIIYKNIIIYCNIYIFKIKLKKYIFNKI